MPTTPLRSRHPLRRYPLRRLVAVIGASTVMLALNGCSLLTQASPPNAQPGAVAAWVAPASVAPSSPTPTTTAPTSPTPKPSKTTTAPSSAPPTTTAPSTATPTTASPTATPVPQPSLGSVPWWVWLVLAAAVIGVGVYLIGRGRANQSWERQLTTVSGELTWIHDQLIPQLLDSPTVSAADIWKREQPRVAIVESKLRTLATAAVSQSRAARANHLRRLLNTVTLAVEALVTAPADISADYRQQTIAQVRTAQANLKEALTGGGDPLPPQRMAQ